MSKTRYSKSKSRKLTVILLGILKEAVTFLFSLAIGLINIVGTIVD